MTVASRELEIDGDRGRAARARLVFVPRSLDHPSFACCARACSSPSRSRRLRLRNRARRAVPGPAPAARRGAARLRAEAPRRSRRATRSPARSTSRCACSSPPTSCGSTRSASTCATASAWRWPRRRRDRGHRRARQRRRGRVLVRAHPARGRSEAVARASPGPIEGTSAIGLFRQRGRRPLVRGHAVRADGRAPRDPVLRRARPQGGVAAHARGARGLRAFANMPVEKEQAGDAGWREVTFQRTPPLPSYLVAFAVGDFDVRRRRPRRARTTRRSRSSCRRAAPRKPPMPRRNTGAILAAAERYFGAPYPFPKLDLLAYPDGDLRRRDGESGARHLHARASCSRGPTRSSPSSSSGSSASPRTRSRTCGSATT